LTSCDWPTEVPFNKTGHYASTFFHTRPFFSGKYADFGSTCTGQENSAGLMRGWQHEWQPLARHPTACEHGRSFAKRCMIKVAARDRVKYKVKECNPILGS